MRLLGFAATVVGLAACSSSNHPANSFSNDGGASPSATKDAGAATAAAKPYELYRADMFGDEARRIIALTKGAGRSLIVTTSSMQSIYATEPEGSTPESLHRVEPDGTVAWSVRLVGDLNPEAVTRPALVARVGDDQIAVAMGSSKTLVVLNDSGKLTKTIPLPDKIVKLVAKHGGGITGMLANDDFTASHRFEWSGAGDIVSTPLPDLTFVMGEDGALLVDENDSLFVEGGPGSSFWRIDRSGSAKPIDLGNGRTTSAATARKGGGFYAWLEGGGLSGREGGGVVEIDAAGNKVGVAELELPANLAGQPIVARLGDDTIGATVATNDGARLTIQSPTRSKDSEFTFSDAGSLEAAIVTDDGLWLGGQLRGHIKVGETEQRSGPTVETRPFLLRITSLDAIASFGVGVDRCAAKSNGCSSCLTGCMKACTDTTCTAAHDEAALCACRAPEGIAECGKGTTGFDQAASCYTGKCANACGTKPED